MNRKYRNKAIRKEKEVKKEKMKNGKSIVAIAIAAIMVISVMTAIIPSTTAQQGETTQQRLQFAHNPANDNLLDDTGIYIRQVIIDDVRKDAIRLYGEPDKVPPKVYDTYDDAFDPRVIPKDSATFNPAIIRHTDDDFTTLDDLEDTFTWIKASAQDANLKKYLRIWYEPVHVYEGPRTDAGLYPATTADVIQVESTYMLLDAGTYKPVAAAAGTTSFPFPTEGLVGGGNQPGLDTMRRVDLTSVSSGTTTAGTIELQRELTLGLGVGDIRGVEFLDHRITYLGLVTGVDGHVYAQMNVEYIGNTFADAVRTIDVRERTYLDRSNYEHGAPDHTKCTTFYVELKSYHEDLISGDTATIKIGKEIKAGDIFYVDGVRYDVPAIYTVDGELKYMTFRTPLPKSDPEGAWTSASVEELIDGQWQVQDFSKVTTQWIVNIDCNDPIPVDPPFNRETYTMVDDTDVQLWEQGPLNTRPNFPYGATNPALPDGGDGLPRFPEGERYLTTQNPLQAWVDYFDAVATGFEDSIPDRLAIAGGINHDAWIGGETNFTWIKEWYEGRYSTNLLEILTEPAQVFDKYDIQTMPDQYTEFVLPDMPNPVSELTVDLITEKCTLNGTYRLLGGDYLITTSLRLEEGTTRLQFTYDPLDGVDELNSLDNTDIYVNELAVPVDSIEASVRLYGEPDKVPPKVYDTYDDAFDPRVIPKDSATFNPAIIRHTDDDFTTLDDLEDTFTWIKASAQDANLKKYLRIWYEPVHVYEGPRTDAGLYPATTADVIQVESTYMLLDAGTYKPVAAAAGTTSFPFPTEGLVGGGNQPGLDTMRRVDLTSVSSGTTTAGTIELQRELTLGLGVGDIRGVEFLDHRITYLGLVTGVDGHVYAQMNVEYIGNTFADAVRTIDVRERTYLDRSNYEHGAPDHTKCTTFYVELKSYHEDLISGDTATIKIGKEIKAGDIFYVDGVRYDVPAIYTVDGELKYMTFRTPLPKSDPEGAWTSASVEELIDGQWQVQDFSKVTTQWIVNIDCNDPIPVDPPFNRETYTMVDDTDVQLWEQGPLNTRPNFPYGATNPALPDGGDGLPRFPEGERYLTTQNPLQAWVDYFDAVATGFEDSIPDRLAIAGGINHDAWIGGETNFTWIKEWYEGRYSTNLLEILTEPAQVFDKYDIQTMPDQYTEFVLPDMPNPVSELTVDLITEKCTLNGTYRLLGGDYLITTSLRLEGELCCDKADTNEDCEISMSELMTAIGWWKAGTYPDYGMAELMTSIGRWKAGSYSC